MPARSLIVILLMMCDIAMADVHRVSDDAGLSSALRNARPGDEIRLAPGTYRGGVHATVQGERDRRITITSDDPKQPAIIEGRSGLHLSDARHVTLSHLVVRKSAGNGVNIDDGGDMDQSAVGIRIERVQVLETGPKGNLDGIKLSGLKDFEIVDTTVAGWGGSAIDMVGCADGVIRNCTIKGMPGFDQSTGIQMKGGTRDVRVEGNQFHDAGQRALNVGGSTGLQFFRPPDAAYEAKDIVVENNAIHGSEAPVAFVGVDGAVFRGNRIVEPKKWVLRILQESRDERFAKCRNVVFEKNVVTYSSKAVRTIANVGPGTAPETFVFRANHWFCTDGPTRKPDLPTPEVDGVYGRPVPSPGTPGEG